MTKFLQALLLALCICSTTAFAQTTGSTEFGVNVGYNAATAVSGTKTNSKFRSGINIGFSADYYFSDSWSLKAKLIYDQKGWNSGYIMFIDSENYGTRVTANYTLNYLTIPVLANWHFTDSKNWYLHFGPYVGVLLNASAAQYNLKPIMNSTDLGLDLGLGVKLPLSPKAKVYFEINGQAGLLDVFQNNSGETVRNSVSAFNIGINF